MGIREDLMKAKKELEEVKQESFAFQILNDYKKQNKRQFIMILTILGMWFATIGYLVYVLNDIQVVETTEEIMQDNETRNNNYIGNDGDINNG